MEKRLVQSARSAFGVIGLVVFVVLAPVIARAAPYASMVMDARSGEVLHSENADSRLHPASLTKMMTLYIAFEAVRMGEISLDTMVTISRNAAAEPPSKLGLRAGQRIQLRYLIRAAAVKSANDAATAIGEAIEGSEAAFARRMNRTARAMGMTRTTFKNANGLTERGHLSTARDMTILGRHVFYDYPQYYNIFSRRSTNAGGTEVRNTNRRFLDAYDGADGIKTGYTRAAGFNLVASAQRRRERIIATVFGGTSTADRNAKVAELLDLGFSRAPSRVAVNKPRLPRYDQIPSDTPSTEVVVASADGSLNTRRAGRIIRENTAPARSPRPRPRGGQVPVEAPPAELLAAIESNVAAAIADVSAERAQPTEPEDTAVADAAAAAATLAVLEETAEDSDTEQSVQLAENTGIKPRPRPVQGTDTNVAGGMEKTPTALAAEAGPETAPGVDEQTVNSLVADATSTPAARPNGLVAQPSADQAPDMSEIDVAALTPHTNNIGIAITPSQADPSPAQTPNSRLDPLPNADEIVLAQAALMPPPAPEPTIRTEPETTEIVTRMSTSGGRHSGISLGSFGTRDQAERTLITVALSDMASFDGALRRVVQRSAGYEANFMGLSPEQAQQACRRISARGRDCKIIGS